MTWQTLGVVTSTRVASVMTTNSCAAKIIAAVAGGSAPLDCRVVRSRLRDSCEILSAELRAAVSSCCPRLFFNFVRAREVQVLRFEIAANISGDNTYSFAHSKSRY